MLEQEPILLTSKEFEKPRDNCAVVGVYSKCFDVSQIAYNGLIELNHRGQESSGILTVNGEEHQLVKDCGLTGIVFNLKHSLPNLQDAHVAIGHNRYSTSGCLSEVQPFWENGIGIAHNGNLTNVEYLRRTYNIPSEIDGAKSDTRVALSIINKMPGNEAERIIAGLKELEGAYSFVFTSKDKLFAARDPLGFRPLSIGKINNDNGFVVASETSAFFSMNAKHLRDVKPGEVVMISGNGVETIALDERSKIAQCIFELIYISRPDAVVFGIPVKQFRLNQGVALANHLKDVDLISPVPRSGIMASQGVAMSAKTPYIDVLYTNPYRGVVNGPRTFIMPNGRDRAATEKYSADEYFAKGKKIGLVDDSIVRGSLRRVSEKLRNVGVEEIHALIASPPLRFPCYYGVDMSSYQEFLARKIPDLEERRIYLNLDSLYHLSYAETVGSAVVTIDPIRDNNEFVFENNGFCGACFTGRYPTSIEGIIKKSIQFI